jgi:GMP synthase (glutamine-hydrolysing)
MTPKVVVLQHVAMEGPAEVAAAAFRAGLSVDTVKLFEGAAVPEVLLEDILVLMGGPMGVSDVGGIQFPFLADEVQLLKARIAADAPTLGICLGAQLLAHAAGARVYPNTQIELGWGFIDFHNQAHEPALAGLGDQQKVLHWHGDTFDLPAGAVHLASTPACKHQAFRLGTRIFGLQFHCEVEPPNVDVWVKEDAAYVEKALGPQGASIVLNDTKALRAADLQKGNQMLDNIFRCMLAR